MIFVLVVRIPSRVVFEITGLTQPFFRCFFGFSSHSHSFDLVERPGCACIDGDRLVLKSVKPRRSGT